MADTVTLMALFDELDPTTEALDRLRELGIPDADITVQSGLPYSAEALGRPHRRSWVGFAGLAGAAAGVLLGLFFTVLTPNLYVIYVGGQPVVPGPPTAVLMYESIMLCLILGTFLGLMGLNAARLGEILHYDPRLSDGKIGVLFRCPPARESEARQVLQMGGAEEVVQVGEGRP